MTSPTSGAAGETSSTGLAANVAGALAYLLGPITGIILLVIEKDSRFVRFHAAQAVVVGIAVVVVSIILTVVSSILAFIPLLGWAVAALLSFGFSIGAFVLWIVLMFKAYSGERWSVPVLGDYAPRLAGS